MKFLKLFDCINLLYITKYHKSSLVEGKKLYVTLMNESVRCYQTGTIVNKEVNGNLKNKSFHLRNKIMPRRLWESVSSVKAKPGFIFTVMSYNVLAQDLVEKHPYLYRNHQLNALTWESRWNKIFLEIRTFSPDVICLQEVQESHIKDFFSEFESLGYSSIYKRRTGIRTDGCAIYYKNYKLKLLEHAPVEFLRPGEPCLDRDNVGLIAKFMPKQNYKTEFVVATTHLLYNPRRNDVRLAQMQLFFSEIDKFSWKEKDGKFTCAPVIVTGDLNSRPDSELYKLIITGRICCNNTLRKPNNVPTSSSSGHPNTNGSESDEMREKGKNMEVGASSVIPLGEKFYFFSVYDHGSVDNMEATTCQDEWTTVDYIFYSVHKQRTDAETKLRLLSRWRLPRKEELNGISIPNRVVGSDHFSLIAKFKLEF